MHVFMMIAASCCLCYAGNEGLEYTDKFREVQESKVSSLTTCLSYLLSKSVQM